MEHLYGTQLTGRPYEPAIQHFSHHHPLELSNLHQSQATATCAACRLIPSGWTYACSACNYCLHAACAQMPTFITHPSHPAHPLSLLPVPAYPDGCFDCDACGGNGTGFSYNCRACGLDLHALCATAAPSVTHRDHPHPLALAFSLPPHYIMGFTCDVCGGKGSKCWLYRCAKCEFDAHMGCATGKAGAGQPHAGQNLIQALMEGGGCGVGNGDDDVYGGSCSHNLDGDSFGNGDDGVYGGSWRHNLDGGSFGDRSSAVYGGGGSSDGSVY